MFLISTGHVFVAIAHSHAEALCILARMAEKFPGRKFRVEDLGAGDDRVC